MVLNGIIIVIWLPLIMSGCAPRARRQGPVAHVSGPPEPLFGKVSRVHIEGARCLLFVFVFANSVQKHPNNHAGFQPRHR